MIDSTQNPMHVGWWGAPYGSHSTLGIGYKVDGDQRFLILNDTWRDVPYYVNYDEYFESVGNFQHSFPIGTKSFSLNAITPKFDYSVKAISLESLNLNISPPLDPDEYAYHSFELADLNGDGLEDLIVCNFRSFTKGLQIYFNNGNAFIEDAQFNPKPKMYQCTHISHTLDFDKDGDLDIAVTGKWSDLNIFVNEGGSINQSPVIIDSIGFFNAPASFIGLEAGDYDLDGDIDLISTTDCDQIRWYRNQNGTFNKDLTFSLMNNSSNGCEKVKLCDMNNDGYPDLMSSSRNGTVFLFYNNNGKFKETPDFSPRGHGGLGFDVADLNNDGWSDIVSSDEGKIIIYWNNSGTFSDIPSHVNDNLDCYPKDFTITDLNNDKFPEIIIANYNRPNIILANNQGQIDPTPAWQSHEVDPTVNVRVFDNDKGVRRLLFGKARGGTLEFYKVNLLTKTLSVTPSNQDVGLEAGSITFTISSNTNWTVSDDADWLTVTPVSGNGNATITVTFVANPMAASSIGTITVSCQGLSPQSVTVSQSRQTGVTKLDGYKLNPYPNPAKDFITLKFDDTIASDFSISVSDALGKSHYVYEYKCDNHEKEITVDLTSLKSGLYFIIVNGQHVIKSYKIIKE